MNYQTFQLNCLGFKNDITAKTNLNWYNSDTCTNAYGSYKLTQKNKCDNVITNYSCFAGDGDHKIQYSCKSVGKNI